MNDNVRQRDLYRTHYIAIFLRASKTAVVRALHAIRTLADKLRLLYYVSQDAIITTFLETT
jgi:hypothetical protein